MLVRSFRFFPRFNFKQLILTMALKAQQKYLIVEEHAHSVPQNEPISQTELAKWAKIFSTFGPSRTKLQFQGF